MNKKILTLIFALFGILGSNSAFAQATETVSTATAFYLIAGFVIIVALLVLAVSVVVLRLLKVIVKQETQRQAEAKGIEYVEPESWWSKFMKQANDIVPIEKEEEIILDHDYDGIRELDNHLPPWWKWLFYASIAFGVVYMIGYHVVGNMPLQLQEYEAQMQEAEAASQARLANMPADNIDESNVAMVDDPSALANGKQVYMNNCSQCHKENAEGGIGPNLTDDYWLHGGDIASVFGVIKNGVPEKGMISWEPLLSPTQMQNVSSYILSLRGTDPPNAKAPQGELYVPEADSAEEIQEEEVATDSLQVAEL